MRQTLDIGDSRRISFREAGTGTPLVLLHGIGSSSASWRPQLDTFAAHFRVLAWDAPGYGDSSVPAASAPTAADYATHLAVWLDQLSIARCHLVGHSLGGLIAAAFARMSAKSLLSLTLADAASGHATLPPAERERRLAGRLGPLRELGPAGMAAQRAPGLVADGAPARVIEQIESVMAQVDPVGFEKAARMLAHANIFADLTHAASIPACVLCGSADKVTTPADSRRIADALPGAQFELIDHAGHMPHVEQPDAFNKTLLRFLDAATR